jgi:2-polyprenyl-6-methoxyphenol hydroxylase-like FAD-dependent oxidoreductase
MGLSGGLLDAEAVADALDLIVNGGQPLSLLDTYAYERQRVFQTFTSPQSMMNKLRCAADPERASEDWLIHTLNTDPESLKDFGRHFFDTWRTDMRSLVGASLSS